MAGPLFQDVPYDVIPGARHYPGYLPEERQATLLTEIRAIVKQAPFYHPEMPRSGKRFSVRMTNCGTLGWVSDKQNGYRYQDRHPVTGKPWPDMPAVLRDVWAELAPETAPAEAALINFYDVDARLGLHRDEDEDAPDAPVVSLSLGDDARFRVGGLQRSDKTRSVRLCSGDAFVLGGAARLAFHGVDKIFSGTSPLLVSGGRINITMRRVSRPER